MAGVSKEQIRQARDTNLFTYLQSSEPGVLKRDGPNYRHREHDSLVYVAAKDYWYWNSRGKKINALDYLMEIRGYGLVEAVNALTGSASSISYHEPVFDSHSHGFRPNRSCHTALRQISSEFTGITWFIEGDIKGCFDNIDHEVLIDILSRKIKDSKFLNVIRQFLKAGYIEHWVYNRTYSGTPQGGICSPILANIYLNEMDRKFEEIKLRFDSPRAAGETKTQAYREMDKEMKKESYWIDHKEHSDLGNPQFAKVVGKCELSECAFVPLRPVLRLAVRLF